MVVLYLLLSLAPCLTTGSCFHGYHSAYSFDANKAWHPDWMGKLPDSVNVTGMSIPGTHDTMTYKIAKFSLQCQNWNLTTQLNAGIRYLDIRARLRDDELHIYHADEPTGFSYETVLSTVFEFLDANPSEFIMMRLKDEGPPLGNNTLTFEAAFNRARNTDALRDGAEKHFYWYNDTSTPFPTLGKLRSKIILLQNFQSDQGTKYGIAWDGPQMVLEDKWIIEDVAHLPEKWDAIKAGLEDANATPLDNAKFFLAHISAAVGVLPIEAAAGPMNHTQTGMNDLTGRWVDDHYRQPNKRVGVVIFDFPGKKVLDSVVKFNSLLWRRAP
jgi:1-phosphatidylinositol phosphodiesterase